MKIRFLSALLVACTMSLSLTGGGLRGGARSAFEGRASSGAPLAADHADCSRLTMLKLPDVKVSEAVAVPAPAAGPITVAHCRVAGLIGTEIKFSLLMPDDWNRKFLMGGGGGFVGSVVNQALEIDFIDPVINAGYATAGTDTGHKGSAVE